MNIREMSLDDLEQVVLVERRAYTHPWTEKMFSDAVISTKKTWVLEQDGNIAGYAILSFVVGEAELLNICIDPTHQGKGLGKALLNWVITEAENSNNADLYLEVRASNQTAYELYLNAGFNEIGRRKGYYPSYTGREDAILMALPLSM